MSTVRTCTNPQDGWALYSHFLGNLLLAIRFSKSTRDEEEDETKKEKYERAISNTWAQLVGNLYMIMRRMRSNGHNEVADKMQQIINMTVELDLTDPGVHDLIHAKQRELDTGKSDFDVELAKLRTLYGKK